MSELIIRKYGIAANTFVEAMISAGDAEAESTDAPKPDDAPEPPLKER
ncbi:MAG: hypothetical protein HIU83_03675 [Proteobacteria bacterium]|nr:hypothetical protein [Pseudomonadota bacterium]